MTPMSSGLKLRAIVVVRRLKFWNLMTNIASWCPALGLWTWAVRLGAGAKWLCAASTH